MKCPRCNNESLSFEDSKNNPLDNPYCFECGDSIKEFDKDTDEKKPTVQVGDPFTEKLLLEACLELMKDDSIISIQDMGAAGLTSSSVEMASKGKLGIELNLNKGRFR